MRLHEIESDEIYFDQLRPLVETAIENCSKMYHDLKQLPYSGRDGNLKSGVFETPTNRKPLSTDPLIHRFLNEVVYDDVSSKRDNSIFITNEPDIADQYGYRYEVLPFDNVTFTCHREIQDLYHYIMDEGAWTDLMDVNFDVLSEFEPEEFMMFDHINSVIPKADSLKPVETIDDLRESYELDRYHTMKAMLNSITVDEWFDFFKPIDENIEKFKSGLMTENNSTFNEAVKSGNEVTITGKYILISPEDSVKFKQLWKEYETARNR